jgi:hypothetical protein
MASDIAQMDKGDSQDVEKVRSREFADIPVQWMPRPYILSGGS